MYNCMVEGTQVSNLSTLSILFGDNEGRGCPFGGLTWFKDTNFNHVIKFLFESLLVYMWTRVSMVMHCLGSRFEFNVNFLVGVDAKGAINFLC